MQSTQEIAELMLYSGRNALLALDIKVSIATLGVGTGALVAGFFGMNVRLPDHTYIQAEVVVGYPSRDNGIRFLGNSRRSIRPRYPSLYLRFPNPEEGPPSRIIRSRTPISSGPSNPNASPTNPRTIKAVPQETKYMG